MDPLELVRGRDALLARVTEHFRADDSTLAIFLASSLADGTADAWSDIDMRIVTTSEAFARVVTARRSTAQTWGDWLFDVWDPAYPNVCVSHFRPFTKIDAYPAPNVTHAVTTSAAVHNRPAGPSCSAPT
jgi:predicted nucleotidyltransferase